MTIQAPAKLNIFLKIVGLRGAYHELFSRFIRYDALKDELHFVENKSTKELELRGNFTCTLQENTIYKAIMALKKAGFSKQIDDFFSHYAIEVDKKIPFQAGLGGGSSDAASVMRFLNETLSLNISLCDLANMSTQIGADVPFFIYGYKSANVSGIGEMIAPFSEDLPEFTLHFPSVSCSTKEVYESYDHLHKKDNFANIEDYVYDSWFEKTSLELLQYYDAKVLNDLFTPAISLHESLNKYYEKGYFMSGSGSSMFEVK